MNNHVWIKLVTAKEDVFARVAITSSDLATDVAERACAKFPRWRLDAGQVRLHSVTVSGTEQNEEEIGAARATKPLAVSATVTSGAWLVAVPTAPGSDVGGGDAGAGALKLEEL